MKFFPLSLNSEILRAIDSLQLSNRIPYIVTPADWVVLYQIFLFCPLKRNARSKFDKVFYSFYSFSKKKPGEKVMIVPHIDDELVDRIFPKGVERIGIPSGKNYLRTTDNY